MHYKNTNFCIKNVEFFQLKNRHFFEFFLTKNVLAKNVRKHLKIRFFSQKLQLKLRYYRKSIAKYIVILSQFCDIIAKISENCDTTRVLKSHRVTCAGCKIVICKV